MAIDPGTIKSDYLYSVAEATDALEVTEQTIYTYLKDGTLKGVKTKKGKWTIPGRELKRFITGASKAGGIDTG